MSVLITGGCGFVGIHVGKKFIEKGFDVILYDTAYREVAIFEKGIPLPKYVKGDITDMALLMEAVTQNGVEGIIHTAALATPQMCLEQPVKALNVNVLGTAHVLEVARKKRLRVVSLSSMSVYGSTPDIALSEDDKLHAVENIYASHKAASEVLVEVYHNVFGVDAVTVRASFVYGPGMNVEHTASEWLKKSVRGDKIDLPSGGDHKIDWTYIKDEAEGIFLAYTVRPIEHRTFNISGGKNVSSYELANAIMKIVPNSSIRLGPGGYKEKVGMRGYADLKHARRELGYEPKYSIERGISEYYEWLKKHPSETA